MTTRKITPEDKAIIENMKAAMLTAEAGKDGYSALNKLGTKDDAPTYALGMYQFVPSVHLENMRSYAREHGNLFGIKESDFPTMEEYKKLQNARDNEGVKQAFAKVMNTPAFQDVFYENWMLTEILPEAKKTYNEYGKQFDMSLEEITGLSHMLGSDGARKKLAEIVKNPDLIDQKISEQNPTSVREYTNKYKTAVIDKGGTLTKPEQFKEGKAYNPNLKETFKEFQDRYEQIKFSDAITDEAKQQAFSNLYQDINENKLGQSWNRHVQNENNKIINRVNDFKNAKTPGGLVHSLIQNNGGMTANRETPEFSMSITEDDLNKLKETLTPEQFEKLRTSKQKIYTPQGKYQETKNYIIAGNTKDFLEIADKEYRNLTNKNLYFDVDGISYKKIDAHDINAKNPFKQEANFDKTAGYEPIDFTKIPKKTPEPIKGKVKDDKKSGKKVDDTKKVDDDGLTEKEKASLKKLDAEAENYFSRFVEPQENIVPEPFVYDDKNYKKEIPWAAIGQGALGLMGMADAKTELPMRDERVSEAILQYSNEMKKLSQIGLRPEEEAKMKNDLASAYSEGITQLVRASGGDRNVVLGNMSSLNRNRIEGMSNIALADIQRKDAALDKYGEVLKYIENFNTNRDVANHDIKYKAAQEKRVAGAQLAQAGFTNMMEELQYQKENGPGSANHRMQKTMEWMLTGVDSSIPDDGKGTTPHTASWVRKNASQQKARYEDSQQIYGQAKSAIESWSTLDPKSRSKYSSYIQYQTEYNKNNPTLNQQKAMERFSQSQPKPIDPLLDYVGSKIPQNEQDPNQVGRLVHADNDVERPVVELNPLDNLTKLRSQYI